MLRPCIASLVAVLVIALSAQAADKVVKGTLVKVDAKKNVLTVTTADGQKHSYDVDAATKFIGPRGGISTDGIKDERLVKGTALTLKVAGNNRTLHEVRIPTKRK